MQAGEEPPGIVNSGVWQRPEVCSCVRVAALDQRQLTQGNTWNLAVGKQTQGSSECGTCLVELSEGSPSAALETLA